jgi:DNA adenine methylase
MTTKLCRSPLPWIGGKFYSRERILQAFPSPTSYTTYVEVFGGAAHILLHKKPDHHLEVYNDYNKDLVNFWMQCRNHPEALQDAIDSLPYARSLYEGWQASLFDGTLTDEMERAVRWFYVLRSSVGGRIRESKGNWGYSIGCSDDMQASKMRNAAAFFDGISSRLRNVQIECKDFAHILTTYERSTTLFYCDPPYIGAEHYYEGVPAFTLADHERLAELLNNTSAKVALSYYPHEMIENLYPTSKWRRIQWSTYKHAEKVQEARQKATELLLCNYEAPAQSLWDDASSTAQQEEEYPA